MNTFSEPYIDRHLLALSFVKHFLLKFVRLLSRSSEIVLFMFTFGGPMLFLVFTVSSNAYLTLKPVLLSLFDRNLRYSRAFKEAKLSVARFMYRHGQLWHRYSVKGFHKIPRKSGAVIVYYHGSIPIDYMLLNSKVMLELNRPLLSVVDRYMILFPGFEMLSAGLGCFSGTRTDCIRRLRAGCLVGIAPGGGMEAQAASSETYEMMWKKRSGFAAVALEAGVPIIPIFTENIREAVCNMQFGISLWKTIYRWTKIPVTPLYGNFPVRLTTHVGDPIYPNPDSTVEDLRSQTVASMEKMIKRYQKLPGNVFRSLEERIEAEAEAFEKYFLTQEEPLIKNFLPKIASVTSIYGWDDENDEDSSGIGSLEEEDEDSDEEDEYVY